MIGRCKKATATFVTERSVLDLKHARAANIHARLEGYKAQRAYYYPDGSALGVTPAAAVPTTPRCGNHATSRAASDEQLNAPLSPC